MDIPGRRFQMGDKVLLTEWFGRGGDGIVVRGEAINYTTDTVLTVVIEVFTKKSTDPGDGTLVHASWALVLDDSPGVKEKILISDDDEGDPGMYDLVRYSIRVDGEADPGDFVVARIFPPVFFDKSN